MFGPQNGTLMHAWGQAHLFCRGSVLTGCNLQMLVGPVGFIGISLPSHYTTLLPSVIFFSIRCGTRRQSPVSSAARLPYVAHHFHPPIVLALLATSRVIIVNWRYTGWLKYVIKENTRHLRSFENPGGPQSRFVRRFSRAATSDAWSGRPDQSIDGSTGWRSLSLFLSLSLTLWYHYDVITDNSAGRLIERGAKRFHSVWRFACRWYVYDSKDYRYIR